jgi:hypothetical protein
MMVKEFVQRGESLGMTSKLSAFGKKHIQRGESPGKAKLPARLGRRSGDHEQPPQYRDRRHQRETTNATHGLYLYHHSTYNFMTGFSCPTLMARQVRELKDLPSP